MRKAHRASKFAVTGSWEILARGESQLGEVPLSFMFINKLLTRNFILSNVEQDSWAVEKIAKSARWGERPYFKFAKFSTQGLRFFGSDIFMSRNFIEDFYPGDWRSFQIWGFSSRRLGIFKIWGPRDFLGMGETFKNTLMYDTWLAIFFDLKNFYLIWRPIKIRCYII